LPSLRLQLREQGAADAVAAMLRVHGNGEFAQMLLEVLTRTSTPRPAQCPSIAATMTWRRGSLSMAVKAAWSRPQRLHGVASPWSEMERAIIMSVSAATARRVVAEVIDVAIGANPDT
jgi:hypothetical protein